MMKSHVLVALGGALLLSACSGSRSPDLGQTPTDGPGHDLSTPPGPDLGSRAPDLMPGYGYQVGDIVAPLSWEGYVNPTGDMVSTKKPYMAYGTRDLSQSGKKYALIHVSEFL